MDVPIGLRAQVEVVHDPELARRQLKAFRNFLLSVSTRISSSNSDADVGDETSSADGLERLIWPLEADVVRVLWAAKVPLSVRQVMWELNAGRSASLRYTTVQTVMASLANKGVLARSREGRADLYRPVASDAAGIAVSRLLAQFATSAIKLFVDQVCAEPKLRHKLRAAFKVRTAFPSKKRRSATFSIRGQIAGSQTLRGLSSKEQTRSRRCEPHRRVSPVGFIRAYSSTGGVR